MSYLFFIGRFVWKISLIWKLPSYGKDKNISQRLLCDSAHFGIALTCITFHFFEIQQFNKLEPIHSTMSLWRVAGTEKDVTVFFRKFGIRRVDMDQITSTKLKFRALALRSSALR